MHSVYILSDPRDHIVRYVGISNNPERRLKQHFQEIPYETNRRKADWLAELKQLSLIPIIDVVETQENRAVAKEREAYWIAHFSTLSPFLTNGHLCYRSNHSFKKGSLTRIRREALLKQSEMAHSTGIPRTLIIIYETGTPIPYTHAQLMLEAINKKIEDDNQQRKITFANWPYKERNLVHPLIKFEEIDWVIQGDGTP